MICLQCELVELALEIVYLDGQGLELGARNWQV